MAKNIEKRLEKIEERLSIGTERYGTVLIIERPDGINIRFDFTVPKKAKFRAGRW